MASVSSPLTTRWSQIFLFAGQFTHRDLKKWYEAKSSHPVTINAEGYEAVVPSNLLSKMVPTWAGDWQCQHCHAKATHMRKCPSCWAHYCYARRQLSDWRGGHKRHCESIDKMSQDAKSSRAFKAKLRTYWRSIGQRGYQLLSGYVFELVKHLVSTQG